MMYHNRRRHRNRTVNETMVRLVEELRRRRRKKMTSVGGDLLLTPPKVAKASAMSKDIIAEASVQQTAATAARPAPLRRPRRTPR